MLNGGIQVSSETVCPSKESVHAHVLLGDIARSTARHAIFEKISKMIGEAVDPVVKKRTSISSLRAIPLLRRSAAVKTTSLHKFVQLLWRQIKKYSANCGPFSVSREHMRNKSLADFRPSTRVVIPASATYCMPFDEMA
jgi:hypothetical protein